MSGLHRISDETIELEVTRRDHWIKVGLLISSLATIGALAAAAFSENVYVDWRTHQDSYLHLLSEKATDDMGRTLASTFDIRLRQIVMPELGRVDRCNSCHTGIEDPRMVAAPQPYRTHPGNLLDTHRVEKFGCSVCHDGQGQATSTKDAHGDVGHWNQPLLRGALVYTSCSRCHWENDLFGAGSDRYSQMGQRQPIFQADLVAHVPGMESESAQSVLRGKRLTRTLGCLGCHTIKDRGGTMGPEITFTGDKVVLDFSFARVRGEHTVAQWLFEHFKSPESVSEGTLMPDYGLSDQQAWDLTRYMKSLHQKTMPANYTPMPPLRNGSHASGFELYGMFCQTCHGEDGRGSTVRYAQDQRAVDAPLELMVPSLNNSDTLAVASNDFIRSIIKTGRPGTSMQGFGFHSGPGLHPQEIEQLVQHVRSWQPPATAFPSALRTLGSRHQGQVLYAHSCASCHESAGQGGIGPSLRAPSAQAVYSSHFLTQTINHGRSNTAMPAWRQLDEDQLADLLAHMRSWHPINSNIQESLRLRLVKHTDQKLARYGQTLFDSHCMDCHGADGMGDLGPSLATQEFLGLVSDEYLFTAITQGRPGTGMPAWRHLRSDQVAALIGKIRTWQSVSPKQLSMEPNKGDASNGRILFSGMCASCHGVFAEGGSAPQLNNPVLLQTATDAMLKTWILYGRTNTAMRGFKSGGQGMVELLDSQVADIVFYLRSLASSPRVEVAKSPNGQVQLGKIWYAESCAGCHGVNGEGLTGPALANPEFLRVASDGFIQATLSLGRDGTEMRPMKKGPQSITGLTTAQIDDLVALLRHWEIEPKILAESQRFVIPWDLRLGHNLYRSNCAGCHGVYGKSEQSEPGQLSAWAPELNNKGFLTAATDGFLQATIVLGRSETSMRPFGRGMQGLSELPAEDINAIVAYIRAWSKNNRAPDTILAQQSDPNRKAQKDSFHNRRTNP